MELFKVIVLFLMMMICYCLRVFCEWISKGIVFDENENVMFDRFFNHGIRMNIVELKEIENIPNE